MVNIYILFFNFEVSRIHDDVIILKSVAFGSSVAGAGGELPLLAL
jgi:hypothetical protein